ncbi:LysR family transcriptional regulator [Saccharopolyspora griseoalba]|uniref:LysR family transcriptional regulator n=1 Tax=Saccharopolyspora griseoalba TaxID=1431848 RepID=A0ABW2LQB9_9PSEU
MTLNQLRAFALAHRLGTFTAVAAELDMAQPSVSELVRRLEEELGTELFVRGSRKLSLSAAGQELLPHAEQALAAADHGTAAVRALNSLRGGTATFGLLRNADYYLLSDLVRQFHERYPDVRVRLVGQNSAETAAAVREGDLEAGLVVLPIDDEGLAVSPLIQDEVRYVSADPRRTREPVTVEDLTTAPLILYDARYGWSDPTRRQLSERAQLAGVSLDARIEVEHVESALRLAADGIGDTIASRAVVRSPRFPQELTTAPFAAPLHDTIALIRRRDRPLSPATTELVRLAENALLTTGRGSAEPLVSSEVPERGALRDFR